MLGKLKNIWNNLRKQWTEITDGYSFASWMQGGLATRSRRELLLEFKNLVHQCATTIAINVAKYEPMPFKTNEAGEKIVVKNNPLVKLLKQPNPNMSQYDLMEASDIFRSLTGEFFWYFELGEQTRRPKSICMIRPDRMKLYLDKDTGEVIGYGARRDDGNEIMFDKDEIAHFKTFNPMNPYRGLGVVEANLLYIEIENSTSAFQYHYMKNQATPSGVLTFRADNKQNIDKEAFKKAKEQWDEQYSGAANAGKTLFVREMDVKFEKVGLSLADLDLAGLKEMTDEKVRNAFKVPKFMLGEADSTGLGRSNAETTEYVFSKYTIEPIQNKYDDFFTMLYNRYWGDPSSDRVEFDHVSQIPEDKEFELKEQQASVNIWRTVNEVRKEENLEPVPGGDQLYVGFNLMAIDAAPAEPTTGKKLTLRLPQKMLAAPKAEPTPQPAATKDVKKKQSEANFFEVLAKLETKSESRYRTKIKSLVRDQEKDVIASLESHLGKSVDELKKAFEQVTPDEATEAAEWADVIVPVLVAAIEEAGPLGFKFMNVEDIEFILSQGARNSVYDSSVRLLKSFNKETTDKIQKQLIQGLNNGENLAQLTARVESVYKEAKGYRALRIANTESHKAINFGVHEAYKSAGVKKMVWRANPGACEFCQAMDGTVTDIGGSFISQGATVAGTDGGEYLADYDDVKLADLHPNCTCTIVPEI